MDRAGSLLHDLFFAPPWCCLAWPAVAMIAGTLVAVLFPKAVSRLGIVPRRAAGLPGIVAAPFVHANLAHLAANLPPFIVLGALLLPRGGAHFAAVAAAIALIQGGLLWLFGRKATHLGMSGVIFGLFGYLVATAWITRTTSDLVMAGVAVLFYGGMVTGVKPARNGTSWEGHLFGLLAGIAVAWLGAR